MIRDSHTPIQVDIPGPKCSPPGLSLKKKIFGSNIGYEVRAVSHFLIVYCQLWLVVKKEFIVFPYGIVLSELFLYFRARFWRNLERLSTNRNLDPQLFCACRGERSSIPKPVSKRIGNAWVDEDLCWACVACCQDTVVSLGLIVLRWIGYGPNFNSKR